MRRSSQTFLTLSTVASIPGLKSVTVGLYLGIAAIGLAVVGAAFAQETVSLPDYFPTDPEIFCKKTYELTVLNEDGTFTDPVITTAEIIGKITVPYTSGSLEGALVCNLSFEGDLQGWFNDGDTVNGLMEGADYLSEDSELRGPLPTGFFHNFELVQDGQFQPWTPGSPDDPQWSWSVQKDLSRAYPNDSGDWDDFVLFQIQDVTVRSVLYEKAIILWDLGPEHEFVEPNFYGKDDDLRITVPTDSERRGHPVESFFILGVGTGIIAGGAFEGENDGDLTTFVELVSISCEGPTFDAFDVPGTMSTTAFGGNDLGQIVGSYFDPKGIRHGLLRGELGVLTTIDLLGAIEVWANDINNHGDVVGRYRSVSDNLVHGFVLSDSGSLTTIDFRDFLPDYPNELGSSTFALGTNDRGDVVGVYPNSFGRMRRGFLYSDSDGDVTFTTLQHPDATWTRARDINNRGDVVGDYRDSEGQHGFLYNHDTKTYTTLDDYPDGTALQTQARGINDRRDIVGVFFDTNDAWHGFLLREDVFTAIDVPCATSTFAHKINNRGDVIGTFQDPDNVSYGFRVPLRLEVTIDIKPGGDPNCFKINGEGVIPVAILGSGTFDVSNVDQSSLSFAGLNVGVRANKGPFCGSEDTNNDGFFDLVCHFEDDSNKWAPGDGVATLTGKLLDGTPFEGTDSICVVP